MSELGGKSKRLLMTTAMLFGVSSSSVFANAFFFSTGNPDGLIATLSTMASPGKLETETADDFVTTAPVAITSATFIGLLPTGTPLSAVKEIEIELYHVFPIDSTSPPDGKVLTRTNSPSDNQFAARDSNLPGQLSFKSSVLDPRFTALNSVVTGIRPIPGRFTGGEGHVVGEEVEFDVTFLAPFILGIDHVFFRPEVAVTGGDFLWLSAPKPIVSPGTPFAGDLQTWIRTDGSGGLAPDWERIGTDVTNAGPFNAAFSLTGVAIPEPNSWVLLGTALLGLGLIRRLLN